MRVSGLGRWLIASLVSVASLGAASDELRLVDAVQKKDHQAVQALLKRGADVNAPQADGATALAWAAHWNDLDTADLLIRAGANVNAGNELGITPLMLACTNASAAMVEKLLRAGANPNTVPPTGETALVTAAITGNAGVVRALLAHGADVNARTVRGGQTVLMWAVAKQHPEVVRVLIEAGADVHARSKSGFGPVLFAALQGDVDTTRILLASGANVNEVAANGSRALSLAIAGDHDALAFFLLDRGADPGADEAGYAALHVAAFRGKLELVKALLVRGVDPNPRIQKVTPAVFRTASFFSVPLGATPLWLAAKPANVDLMRVLLEGGADPELGGYAQTTRTLNTIGADFGPEAQTTPLMVAAGLTHPEVVDRRSGDTYFSSWEQSRGLEAVKLLLEWGADVNAFDRSGSTALHGAANVGATAMVRLLAAHGAKLDVRDKDGQTPFRIAQGHQGVGMSFFAYPETAQALRDLGADTTLGIDFRESTFGRAVK